MRFFRSTQFRLTVSVLVCAPGLLWAAGPDGETARLGGPISLRADEIRRNADLRLPGGGRIRAIYHAPGTTVPTRDTARVARPALQTRKVDPAVATALGDNISTNGEVVAYVVDSPPIDGFVPWIAVSVTDKYKTNDEWDAEASMFVQGNYLRPSPPVPYGIGLLDTGAGISLLSYQLSTDLGVFSGGYNTGGTIEIGGVTGSVDGWVSQPLGLWMAGLRNINPDGTLSTSGMVGEWNVSIGMGPQPDPGAPDIANAIGSPMAVYFASWIRNDTWISVQHGGTTYQGPDITFHTTTSAELPVYPNKIPLELRPSGAADVWFWPCFAVLEYCPGGDGSPKIPSVILGASAQSLFFLGSVNLGDSGRSAPGRTRFMLDTGAQVTVVGSAVAAQLGLNPNNREFSVEIQGVDGTIEYYPGFYVDSIEIPALGEWLSYSKVPVVLLDIASPEGGVLDGIIGMNLFLRYNLIVRGGGLPGMNLPTLEFEPLPSIYADYDYDGDVDMEDFAHLQACLSGQNVPQTTWVCQDAFLDADGDVDELDMRLLIQCASGPNVPASPYCLGQ